MIRNGGQIFSRQTNSMRIPALALLTFLFCNPVFSQLSSPVETQRKPSQSADRAEDQFFSFQLRGCRKSGTTVECELTVKNNGDDRRFNIWKRQIYFYDESGNRYRCTNLRLGQQEDPGTITFVSGVTSRVRLTFSGVDSTDANASMLEIGFGSGTKYPKYTSIKFRNVPFELTSEDTNETEDQESQEENRTDDGSFGTFNIRATRCDVPTKKGVVYIVIRYGEYRSDNAIRGGKTYVKINWGPNKFDRKFPSFMSMTPSRGVVVAARHNSNNSVPLFIETNGTLESCRQLDRPPSLQFYEKANW